MQGTIVVVHDKKLGIDEYFLQVAETLFPLKRRDQSIYNLHEGMAVSGVIDRVTGEIELAGLPQVRGARREQMAA